VWLHPDTTALIVCVLLYCVSVLCCAVLCCVHQLNLLTEHGVRWINGEVAIIIKENLHITGCFHGYVTWSVAFREMYSLGAEQNFGTSGREK
jgi:hypothetical protein